jgi:hypothetical protein
MTLGLQKNPPETSLRDELREVLFVAATTGVGLADVRDRRFIPVPG